VKPVSLFTSVRLHTPYNILQFANNEQDPSGRKLPHLFVTKNIVYMIFRNLRNTYTYKCSPTVSIAIEL